MKPILLRKIAAPSPSVLSFLRLQVKNAFESPAGQFAGSKGQRRAYRAGARIGKNTCQAIRGGFASEIGIGRGGSLGVSHIEEKASMCLLPCRRGFSSTTPNQAWGIFKGARQKQLPPPAPPLTAEESSLGGSGFSSSLGRIMRPANELKMRCTELDEHGNVTLVSGEFKKSELIAKVRLECVQGQDEALTRLQYGLLPRDLRKIDSSLLPHILVRPSAILINLLNLRVLLKHNRVLVFDAYGTTDSKSQSVFMYDLDLKLRQKESPATGTLAYEFRALEAVLISVTLSLEKEFEGVSEPVVKVLRDLEEDIDRDKLRYLLIYSKRLGSFEQKARLVRNALEELLEADDDLSAMYLSEKAEGKLRDENNHTEVEMLLESYHKVADEIVQAAENLVSSIRNTEEMYVAPFPPLFFFLHTYTSNKLTLHTA